MLSFVVFKFSIRITGSQSPVPQLTWPRYFAVVSVSRAYLVFVVVVVVVSISTMKTTLLTLQVQQLQHTFAARTSEQDSRHIDRKREKEKENVLGRKISFIRYGSVEMETRSLHFSRSEVNGPFWVSISSWIHAIVSIAFILTVHTSGNILHKKLKMFLSLP